METTVQLVLIAIAVGVPIGAVVLSTNWEKRVRRLPLPWLPFGHGSMQAVLFGIFFAKLPFGLALFMGVPYLLLNYFDFIPLRGENLQLFFLSYLLSLGLGKLLRYGYWRWAFRGQLV